MTRFARRLRLHAIVAAVLLLPALAFCDGCFFQSVALPDLPRIPMQRALVAYKDGEEHLIVESALDGEGQSFGWVLPVPAEPSELTPVSPGLLVTLDVLTAPKITDEVMHVHYLYLLLWLAVVVSLVATSRLAGAPPHGDWRE